MNTRTLLRLVRPLSLLLCLALLAPAALAQQPEPAALAQPKQISYFGMNTYFTGLERNSRDGDAGVATLIGRGRQIGVSWAREELSWGNLERDAKGMWVWDHFDRRLLATAQAGYGIVGMLVTTPAWARVSDCHSRIVRYASAGVYAPDYWCPPANPQDFADYVYTVVERYDGDGRNDAAGSPRVAVWQLWNEPNAWETWPGSAAEFGALLQAGYSAAKAADPSTVVAIGGLYVFDGQWRDGVGHGDGLRFLDDVIAARPAAWSSFDALAIHPYMPDVAPDEPGLYGLVTLWGRLNTARSWLTERTQRFGGAPRPLWVTELGWSTCTAAESDCYAGLGAPVLSGDELTPTPQVYLGPSAALAYPSDSTEQPTAEPADVAVDGSPTLNALIGKSEEAQANYLVRSQAISLAFGVQHMSWFQLEDKFDGSARNFWEEAAIFRTAGLGYGPKPAAVAYATMVKLLSPTSFVGFGPLHSYVYTPGGSNPAGRYHLRFRTADNRLIDVLWRTGGSELVRLPLESRNPELFDRNGTALSPVVASDAARFTIGEAPIYVRLSAPAALAVSPSQLSVVARPSDPPQTLGIRVANSGSGFLIWNVTLINAPWASLDQVSGEGVSGTPRISISAAGLAVGRYSGTLRVQSNAGTFDMPLRLIVADQVSRRYMPLVR